MLFAEVFVGENQEKKIRLFGEDWLGVRNLKMM
jgi:hypothetical protein